MRFEQPEDRGSRRRGKLRGPVLGSAARNAVREERRRYRMRFDPYPKSLNTTRGSVMVLGFVMFLFSLVLILSLFRIQIEAHADYSSKAAALHYRRTVIQPERGQILDRNGLPLAITTYDYTIGMTPHSVASYANKEKQQTRAQIAAKVSEILGLKRADFEKDLADEDSVYTQIKKHVQRPEVEKLKAYLNEHTIYGFRIDSAMQRSYPEKETGANVVGFASSGGGVIGVEARYDKELAGQPGYAFRQEDNAAGLQLPFTEGTIQEARPGYNVQLSIDTDFQAYCEELIDYYVQALPAKEGGEIIAMDSRTGGILAMASSHRFDLNEPYAQPRGGTEKDWDPFNKQNQMEKVYKNWRNEAISRLYEPGSTIKALTVAMALEEKVAGENELFSDVPVEVPGFTDYAIRCWAYPGNHGSETMYQALANSCNPVMVRLSFKLGIERFYNYVRAFGLRSETGVDLPGEAVPMIHREQDAQLIDMAAFSFGESNAVTPLHLVNSYAVFANKGKILTPHVVERLVDAAGNTVREVGRQEGRQVISAETAQKMLEYLRGPVYDGPHGLITAPGYGMLGKTSTSNYTDNQGVEHAVLSFCSIAPSWDPHVVCLVVLHDTPSWMISADVQYICSQVTERALQVLGVKRDYSEESISEATSLIWTRDLAEKPASDAARVYFDLAYQVVREPGMKDTDAIKFQYPPAGVAVTHGGFVYIGNKEQITEMVRVPQLIGMDYDQARSTCRRLGLNLRIQGDVSKRVKAQSVEAGQELLKYSVLGLDFGEE